MSGCSAALVNGRHVLAIQDTTSLRDDGDLLRIAAALKQRAPPRLPLV